MENGGEGKKFRSLLARLLALWQCVRREQSRERESEREQGIKLFSSHTRKRHTNGFSIINRHVCYAAIQRGLYTHHDIVVHTFYINCIEARVVKAGGRAGRQASL
jgi:hypothetical protein